MAIRSGFFNSVNGDRKYNAGSFAEYFASFIGNGVFPVSSDNLQVISNDDMTVTIKPGKAWINGFILINDNDYVLELTTADGVLNRVDRIVLRYDVVDREIRLEVKQGDFATDAVAKDLQRDEDAYELGLADIQVNKGIISITQANITDLRLNDTLCGIVHGTVDQVDTTTLFNQYQSWYTTNTTQAENDIANIKQQFQNDLIQFNNDWNDWFSQQQTEGFVLQTEKGQADGVATLDLTGNVPVNQLSNIQFPVVSVNNKTGAVVLSASDVGAEIPTGAQEKANTAESNAKAYTDQEVLALAGVGNTKTVKELDDTKVDKVTGKGLSSEDYTTAEKNKLAGIDTGANKYTHPSIHPATMISIEDAVNNFSASNVEGALTELFTNVSSGKNNIASAIADMGQSASGSDTFSALSSKIRDISNDATASISDISIGKTAYVNGSKVTGTNQYKAGQEYLVEELGVSPGLKSLRDDMGGATAGATICSYGDYMYCKYSFSIKCFNKHTGALLATYNTEEGPWGIDCNSKYVYATDSAGFFYRLTHGTLSQLTKNKASTSSSHGMGSWRPLRATEDAVYYYDGGSLAKRSITGSVEWIAGVVTDGLGVHKLNGRVFGYWGENEVYELNPSTGAKLKYTTDGVSYHRNWYDRVECTESYIIMGTGSRTIVYDYNLNYIGYSYTLARGETTPVSVYDGNKCVTSLGSAYPYIIKMIINPDLTHTEIWRSPIHTANPDIEHYEMYYDMHDSTITHGFNKLSCLSSTIKL